MEEMNETDKMDEVMLPGFRFHPTDEELVGFYLRRKIQQKPLAIELIKQLDIYKYDPWELPKLAAIGEKEWYFYCPRDRKYRNSARPNRVTGAGFWKATGTDRPVYSSESSKCIGLKKSLVFYKGRAAKGTKTDWMMHEFRLPSVSDAFSPIRHLDKNIPASDAWAVCKIFKKASSINRRPYSNACTSPVPDSATASCNMTNPQFLYNSTGHLIPSNITSLTNITKSSLQVNDSYGIEQASFASFSLPPILSREKYIAIENDKQQSISVLDGNIEETHCTFQPSESNTKCIIKDASSLLLKMSSSVFGDLDKAHEEVGSSALQEQYVNLSNAPQQDAERNAVDGNENKSTNHQDSAQSDWFIGLPYSCPLSIPDAWRLNFLLNSPTCPGELSTSYSINQCYT